MTLSCRYHIDLVTVTGRYRFDGHVLLRGTYVPDFGTPPPNEKK